jgi:hypothetical protein
MRLIDVYLFLIDSTIRSKTLLTIVSKSLRRWFKVDLCRLWIAHLHQSQLLKLPIEKRWTQSRDRSGHNCIRQIEYLQICPKELYRSLLDLFF